MKALHLQELLIRFFNEHLRQQRQVSRHTILAYRDTFRLLLRFLKRTYHVCLATLELSGLSPGRVLAFLAHLEQQRSNSVRSRNARLAAIRSFAHYVEDTLGPDLPESIREESTAATDFVIPPHRTLAEIEKMAILQTLQRTNWNKQEAAQILGLYRPTLYSKMKKHDIRDGGKAARTQSASNAPTPAAT